MTKLKLGLWAALALVVVALLGWLYGRSGTSPLRTELESKRLQVQLLESRSHLLDARVSTYMVNFGNASRSLEYAKGPMRGAREYLERNGYRDLAAKLEAATLRTTEAQQLAAKFSQDANSRAAAAVDLIDEVRTATKPSGQ